MFTTENIVRNTGNTGKTLETAYTQHYVLM